MVKPGHWQSITDTPENGDGSPCERMWDWIEQKKFETKDAAFQYLNEAGGNDHAYECVENYPWPVETPPPPPPPPREVVYHVYLEKERNRDSHGRFARGFHLTQYYELYIDPQTGRRTSFKPEEGDIISDTVEHIR